MKYFMFAFLVYSIQISLGFSQNKNEEKQDTNVIKELQLNLKNLTDDFNKFNIELTGKLKRRFDEEEKHVAEQIQTLKNDILPEIDPMNPLYKEENHCYKIALEKLDKILENATNKVRQCQFNELFFDFAPIYLHINFTVNMSYDLIDNLESMKEGCAYSNDEEICLMNSKLGVEILFNNLNNSVSQLKQLANKTSTVVLSVFQECISKEMSSVRNTSQSIINEAQNCFSIV